LKKERIWFQRLKKEKPVRNKPDLRKIQGETRYWIHDRKKGATSLGTTRDQKS